MKLRKHKTIEEKVEATKLRRKPTTFEELRRNPPFFGELIKQAKREGDEFYLLKELTELEHELGPQRVQETELYELATQVASVESIRLDLADSHQLTADQQDVQNELAEQSVWRPSPRTPGTPEGPRNAGNAFKQCAAILMHIGCEEYRTTPRQHIQKQTRKRIAQRAVEVLLQDPPGGQITVDTVLLDAGLRDEDLLDAGLRDKALLDLVVDFNGRITEQAREHIDQRFPNARELMRVLPPPSYRDGDRVYKAAK